MTVVVDTTGEDRQLDRRFSNDAAEIAAEGVVHPEPHRDSPSRIAA